MDIICDEETQQLMLDEFNTACVPDKIKDPACIEGLGATLYKRSPNLQKRFLPILPAIAVVIAIDALLIAVYAELIQESGPEYKAVTQVHYESSVLASVSALSSATKASVVLVETTVGDKQAITVSTSELISFNPSSTTSSPSKYVSCV